MIKNFFLFVFRNKIYKEVFFSFLSKFTAIIFFVLINITLARNLGVEKFGLWSLFFSVIIIVSTISSFGVNSSTRKFVAQYKEKWDIKKIIIDSLKLKIFLIFFPIIFFLFFSKNIIIFLNSFELDFFFIYGVPLVILIGFNEYIYSIFLGKYRIKYCFILNLIQYGSKLFLILFFFHFSISLLSVINSFIISLFITFSFGFYLLYAFFLKDCKKSNKSFQKDILYYSFPLFFSLIGLMVLTELDILMLGIFSTTYEVGIYSVGKQLISKFPHIALAISMGTLPIFAKFNKKNKTELRKKFKKLLKINFIIYFSLITIFFLFSDLLVLFLFGNEYVLAAIPLKILLIYIFLYSNSIFLNGFLEYTGNAKKIIIPMIITIILNLALNIILIPIYGAIGAAVATSISYIPYFLIVLFGVKKILS